MSSRRAIPESGPASKKPECVKKLIFCSGKVAITIDELRKEKKMEEQIAMCRIEQLYPFPYDIVLKVFKDRITVSTINGAKKKRSNRSPMCRIEQLYPIPYDVVLKEYCRYQKARVCFCQEEHKNQGPWTFVKSRIENLLDKKVEIISRPSSAASATGIKWIHAKELKELKENIIK